jgi:magnesium-transporting ATPase (P-type)
MSVIYRDENLNKIFLLTKGADEIILERLADNNDQ